MKQFSSIYTEDFEMQKIQDNVGDVLNLVTTKTILDGNLIKNVSLESGVNSIGHLLGRVALGWVIVDKSANEGVWSYKAMDQTFLYLQSSGAVTVSLWVF